ncbi:MAG: serine hydrolase [Clostridia bacterium]|nr:serine hydrolase [Clostridia bacterium]
MKYKIIALLTLFFLLTSCTTPKSQSPSIITSKIEATKTPYTPQPTLAPEKVGYEDLEKEINNLISQRSGEEYSVYVKNLNTNTYFSINDHAMYSASLIKLFIMSAIYEKISMGELEYSDHIKDMLRIMIEESDNDAANELVTILGNGNIDAGFDVENEISQKFGCTMTKQQTGLQDVRTHPAKGRNYTSSSDCAKILELIYRNEFINETYSNDALFFLKSQVHTYKIPYVLPKDTVTANKTGEMTGVQNDVAIVYTPNCDYILAVMGNGISNESSGISMIQTISSTVYNYMTALNTPLPSPTPIAFYQILK